ncbi:type II toxin-antitoxin system VapC family toxin [Streptomyces microflavus]|uniref:type II toxin-antitoxin system VapC family toxin n=1 Tax=Streptomyces microflavus TaxID=1919 RepID=UPI0029BB2720|nr:type II toxin-antitoxin system VapC family toxin [Streptomyces microflavus]MDX2402458.1 type II toxin-antitoxin system VapC family toxin [Streptomyces microflavus]
MRLLLDTRVIVWWLGDAPELSEPVKHLLDTTNAVHISAVSPWEITLKQHLGLIEGPGDLAERVRDLAFPSLPVTAAHGVRAGRLPMVHDDPFDRILVAQAQAHGLVLVTRNPCIPSYDVEVMPV